MISGRHEDAFHGILGHHGPTRILRTALDSGRIPHAFLFAGPPGVGKTTVAGHLAQAILCTGADARPCGTCPDCQRAAHGNAFNRIDITPDGTRIKIEQIRSATELMITGAERGVLILSPAEAMGEQAANALLKTLEEPPSGWVLILVSANLEGLLPTIRSRCQVVHFNRLAEVDCAQILANNGMGSAHITRLSRLAQGAPGGLLKMGMSDAELMADYAEAVGVLQPNTLKSAETVIAAAESWGRDLEATRRFLTWSQVYASEALYASNGAVADFPSDDDAAAAHWANHFGHRLLPDFILRLEQVFDQLGRNINRQSAIEDLLVMLRSAQT